MSGGVLPLYRVEGELPRNIGDGHLGLWFDKFFDEWRNPEKQQPDSARSMCYWSVQPGGKKEESPKSRWIRRVASVEVSSDRRALLQESIDRYVRMVETLSGRWRVFKTESRFVTGLGRTHPVENGFAWHPTLGVPYLPGSSVKGLLRTWARWFYNDEVPDLVRRIFGPSLLDRSGGDTSHQGAVAFLDATPCRVPKLSADVMTPHYGNWSTNDPPGDWRSPVPVPFLTTEAGARFIFGFIPCGDVTSKELDQVMDWLTEALDWIGAGAKTAVGYGRMTPDDALQRRLQQPIQTR